MTIPLNGKKQKDNKNRQSIPTYEGKDKKRLEDLRCARLRVTLDGFCNPLQSFTGRLTIN